MFVRGMHNYRFLVYKSFSQKLFARGRNRNHFFRRIQKCGQTFVKSFKVASVKERVLGHRIIHSRNEDANMKSTAGALTDTTNRNRQTECNVLQFHGYFWHDCPTCYQVNRNRTLSSTDRNDTIDVTIDRNDTRVTSELSHRHIENGAITL